MGARYAGLRHLQVEEPDPGLLVVRLNRPEVLNGTNTAARRDLRAFLRPPAVPPGDLRRVIPTGAGDKGVNARGHPKEPQGMSDTAWRAQHAIIEEGAYAIINASIPVIAAVNG